MQVNRIVYDYLDNLEDGTEISGWELADKINSISGRRTYPSTILKVCRTYCSIVGGQWECINKSRSIYRFHKGKITLDGFIPYGKE